MDASILIATYNRAASLGRTLESLTLLRVPDGCTWEVAVIDNGSTDDTATVAGAFRDRLHCVWPASRSRARATP